MFSSPRMPRFLTKTLLFMAVVGCSVSSFAREGMWLPPTLKYREADMIAMGLQVPVSKLYNEDGTGLNNAVVLFGSGCTGEIISGKGLLLTNHHCGYGTVQGLSSREKDYFANGFWAMNLQEEIPCPGLSVTFIRKMENVTEQIIRNIPDTMNDGARNKLIADRIAALEKGYRYTTKMDASIKPYFQGNQYWVSITETYKDVRLVGFPPNGIGQFGGDTDNWMWPRHTGDFSIFRIYAGPDNKPAPYSKDNKPYETKNFFTINTNGYEEGDFSMVYGFPGSTQEYISSYQLNQIYKIIDPIRIDVRTKRLDAWTKSMNKDRDVFLKYTSKRASVANGWKKWQGEVRGLRINDVSAKKAEYEQLFTAWTANDTKVPWADNVLPLIMANASLADSAIKTEEYIREAVYGIELIQQAATLDKMLQVLRSKMPEARKTDSVQKLQAAMTSFYKNYDIATDRRVFNVLMPLYFSKNAKHIPEEFRTALRNNGNDFSEWASYLYKVSMLAREDKLREFAANVTTADSIRIQSDPAWRLYHAMETHRTEVLAPIMKQYAASLAYYNRLYTRAQMQMPYDNMDDDVAKLTKDEMGNPIAPDAVNKPVVKQAAPPPPADPNKIPTRTGTGAAMYPDANLTLRLTYGKVDGIDPDGAAPYSFQTYLDEAIAKNNPDVEEFRVPKKLVELYDQKDFGRWAIPHPADSAGKTVPIAFIASNHTSGGNSGSPVLNAKGELIGTNFDRIWEGTMSDLYFDPKLCRNITLDVRYTLFIIEKFGNAGWLLNEMKFAEKPKAGKPARKK